jgi:hypothetical protein
METIVYRKIEDNVWIKDHKTSGSAECRSVSSLPGTSQEGSPLSPELFYPLVSAAEMVTWTHWLPTTLVFERAQMASPTEVSSALTKLDAPPEVLEELHWSWKMSLFEAYEVRTPSRRDLRDPLLLGRLGTQHYRMALWGESLRPLEEITSLVQRSLTLRARVAKWRAWLALSGAFLGSGVGIWLGSRPSFDGSLIGTSLAFAMLGLLFTGFPLLLYTPENCQHDFLDRYRR